MAVVMGDDREQLVAIVGSEPDVRFALLFGSRAAGVGRPSSDWDIGVYLSETLRPAERLAVRRRLAACSSRARDIDVVVLNEAPPLLAQRALQGERLLCRDALAYVRFLVRSLAASQDERPWRELHDRARRDRLREGRFGRP
jgi:predicted nucleotidyltransferase